MDFHSVALRRVADTLSQRAGVPIVLDRGRFEDTSTSEPRRTPPAKASKAAEMPTKRRDGDWSNSFTVTASARDVTLETAVCTLCCGRWD